MCAHHGASYGPNEAGHPPGPDPKEPLVDLAARRLTAATGLCAAAAGALFIGVQVGHPPADVGQVDTAEMALREGAKALMCVLAVAGLAGMAVRHRRHLGAAGFAGYVLLSVGYLAMFAVQCVVGVVLPGLADTNPAYVQDVLDAATGGSAAGDIGHLPILFSIAGLGFSLGGLLFGIALFRAGVLARWASLLLAVGTTSALALAVLPDAFNRPFAVPTGLALIGLGASLWRDQRPAAASPDLAVAVA